MKTQPDASEDRGWEDSLGELPLDTLADLQETLATAETVETSRDFVANIEEAIEYAEKLAKELRELLAESGLGQARKHGP